MAGSGRLRRATPAVMLAAALAMSVLALFIFVPHDHATELLYKRARASRANSLLSSIREAQRAQMFVHSLKERERAAAQAGGLEAQVWGSNAADQRQTYQYFHTLRARLHTLQSMLAPVGNTSAEGENSTNATAEAEENATEVRVRYQGMQIRN